MLRQRKVKKVEFKLTHENYFSGVADTLYMSNSQYKGFLECEAKAIAKLKGEIPKTDSQAFIQGRYVHSWNEGTMMQFEEEHRDLMIAKAGKNKGGLKKEFQACGDAIETLKNDPMILKALEGQKEVIMTAELFGIEWKCMLDSYYPDKRRFADLKYLKAIYDKFWDSEEHLYSNPFEHYGYYTQLALYAEIERKFFGRPEEDWYEPFIVVVTKQDPPDKMIISFDSKERSYKDFIREHLILVEKKIERVKLVKAQKVEPHACGVCDYCRSVKMLKGTTHYQTLSLY